MQNLNFNRWALGPGKMQDSWQSGDPYEYYMGRWSRLVAKLFIDWLSPNSWLQWLDIGCGSGALSESIVNGCRPLSVTAVDQSEDFVRATQQRLGGKVKCQVGNALSLPLDDSSIDIAVAGLVLNFLPEPEKALVEMRRVTKKGGTVAAYVWDYAGTMDFLNQFWDAAVALNPKASSLHEGRRFAESNAETLRVVFECVGFTEVETAPLEIAMNFVNFDDYWQPFLGGQGPAPTYVSKLEDSKKRELRNSLIQRLPVKDNGFISLSARAWAVKGLV